MKARAVLRWVPTASDGRRWELWRGKEWLGRVMRYHAGVDIAFVLRKRGSVRLKLAPVESMRDGGHRLINFARGIRGVD